MYNDLTLKQKAELIRLGVSNGIYSLKDIKDTYNKFEEGEYKETISEKMSSSYISSARQAMRNNIIKKE